MNKSVLALAGIAMLASTPAFADDSSAALGMGGIVFTQNADIRMASEDLSLSPKLARVRYEFVNDSGKDIDTIVAFPLPDVDLWEYWRVAASAPWSTSRPISSASS